MDLYSEMSETMTDTLISDRDDRNPIPSAQSVVIGVTGNKEMKEKSVIQGRAVVVDIIYVVQPYKLTARKTKPDNTIICPIDEGTDHNRKSDKTGDLKRR